MIPNGARRERFEGVHVAMLKRSAVGLALAAAVVGVGQLGYRLTVRYGRLLLELEQLQRQLDDLRRQLDEQAP
jgi:hypothetical protein